MQNTTLNIAGLYTDPSPLAEVPPGALSVAHNVDIDSPSIATPRKGFSSFGTALPDNASGVYMFDGKVLVQYGSKLAYWNGTAWVEYSGTVDTFGADKPIRTAPAGKSLLLATNTGVKKLTSATATTVQDSGVPAPTHISVTAWTPAGKFNFSSAAYRATLCYVDEHNTLVESAPSQRVIAQAYGYGGCFPTIRVYLTGNFSTPYFVRLYRSERVDISTTIIEPSDDLQLVAEIPCSGSSSVSHSDRFGEDHFLAEGAYLYTSPTQEGLGSSNEQPPRAEDVAIFNDTMFFLNPSTSHQLLLRISNPSAIIKDDVLTIGGVNYIAKKIENASAREFKIHSSVAALAVISVVDTVNDTLDVPSDGFVTGDQVYYSGTVGGLTTGKFYYVHSTPTATTIKLKASRTGSVVDLTATGVGNIKTSENEEDAAAQTAQSLVRVINEYSGSTVTASWVGDGSILLRRKNVTDAAFAVTSSPARTGAYVPKPPTTGTALSSKSLVSTNQLAWSKYHQFESVPLTNYHPGIGSARARSLRILPTRDSLFILKEDGIWRLTGTAGDFQINEFDNTVQVIAPNAAVLIDNAIYCMTTDGVARVTDLGVELVSGPIRGDLLKIRNTNPALFDQSTFAIAHDGRYILSYPSYSGHKYVFNTRTNAWTTWGVGLSAGVTNPEDGELYAVWDGIVRQPIVGGNIYADFIDGATLPFASQIGWQVKSMGNPALLNQFSSINLVMLADCGAIGGMLQTSSNVNDSTITQSIVGAGNSKFAVHRRFVPRNHQRASVLNVSFIHNRAGYYAVSGISINGVVTSDRVKK